MPDHPQRVPSGQRAATPRRLGPRPLPLHLGVATMMWLGSNAALRNSKAESPPLKEKLAQEAASLGVNLDALDPDAFAAAVDTAARRQLAEYLTAITRYRGHGYRRSVREPPVLWQDGATRLLDYGVGAPRTGVPVLVVPSLINRAYVLDLSKRRSLMRHLAAHGCRPYLVDWGSPGSVERGFTLTDYIAGRLEGALDAVREATGERPVAVVGYCMGGLLALALALRRERHVASLALLATPWDFHAERPDLARAAASASASLMPMFDRFGSVPVDYLQALFASLDPLLSLRKFSGFARMAPGSEREAAFVALEDWVNDGVDLPAPVARECLIGWYGENWPARGLWRVGEKPVRPQDLALPSLVVVPENDRIVPPASARALAAAIPGSTCLTPHAGHIGMVVGSGAEEAIWQPLSDWLGETGNPT